jgi:hypothetical protein
MVKLKNTTSNVDSSSGMSGSEFLAKYYPDYKSPRPTVKPRPAGKSSAAAIVYIILAVLLIMIIHSC